MANEITASVHLKIENGGAIYERRISDTNFDQTASGGNGGIQTIGTTEEAVALGDVTASTRGWAYFKNLDSTNFVQFGVVVSATFYPLFRLNAGEFGTMRLTQDASATSVLYAKADTANVKLEYYIGTT